MNYTYKNIWLINVPVMMSILIEQLINITDAVFLGHVGEIELGASAVAGQLGGKEDNGERTSIAGWALLFHPDLLHGFPLEKRISEYSFFDYRVNEALHMTDAEHGILVSLMRQMRDELAGKADKLQNAILVGYIELALNFCLRFYNRQFITRKIENSDILVRFEHLLRDYFEGGQQLSLGLPTVQYCADKLCMSPNYFGDVVKKTTGDTAGNHIRRCRLCSSHLS